MYRTDGKQRHQASVFLSNCIAKDIASLQPVESQDRDFLGRNVVPRALRQARVPAPATDASKDDTQERKATQRLDNVVEHTGVGVSP